VLLLNAPFIKALLAHHQFVGDAEVAESREVVTSLRVASWVSRKSLPFGLSVINHKRKSLADDLGIFLEPK